jgi:hypothetical protein
MADVADLRAVIEGLLAQVSTIEEQISHVKNQAESGTLPKPSQEAIDRSDVGASNMKLAVNGAHAVTCKRPVGGRDRSASRSA